MLLRPVNESDVADVLRLNHDNVELLAPMDEPKLWRLRDVSARFDVVTIDDAFAGFVIGMTADSEYWSQYFTCWRDRYDDFFYLDRIVLMDTFRRRGLGTFVYDEIEKVAANHGRMTLEANRDNAPSRAFHEARGYQPFGEFDPDGNHPVMQYVKELA